MTKVMNGRIIFQAYLKSINTLIIKRYLIRNCRESNAEMQEEDLLRKARQLVPPLTSDKHKGQAGRIGVIGGSYEYTGAPYFSAISALRVGADLVHVFCVKDAANAIKSYSPDLIVHPILDAPDFAKQIEPWLDRLHAVVLGPGLGRENKILENASTAMELLKAKNKPLVIDADGLYLITEQPQLIKDYLNVILTPNQAEYMRLMKVVQNMSGESMLSLNEHVTIVQKGPEDEIFNKTMEVKCSTVGSNRRCGGQGDILSGAIAVFYAWAMNAECNRIESDIRTLAACFGACHLVRETNKSLFESLGRSMVTNDIVQGLGKVFKEQFEE